MELVNNNLVQLCSNHFHTLCMLDGYRLLSSSSTCIFISVLKHWKKGIGLLATLISSWTIFIMGYSICPMLLTHNYYVSQVHISQHTSHKHPSIPQPNKTADSNNKLHQP